MYAYKQQTDPELRCQRLNKYNGMQNTAFININRNVNTWSDSWVSCVTLSYFCPWKVSAPWLLGEAVLIQQRFSFISSDADWLRVWKSREHSSQHLSTHSPLVSTGKNRVSFGISEMSLGVFLTHKPTTASCSINKAKSSGQISSAVSPSTLTLFFVENLSLKPLWMKFWWYFPLIFFFLFFPFPVFLFCSIPFLIFPFSSPLLLLFPSPSSLSSVPLLFSFSLFSGKCFLNITFFFLLLMLWRRKADLISKCSGSTILEQSLWRSGELSKAKQQALQLIKRLWIGE